jgi:hypothetical protein
MPPLSFQKGVIFLLGNRILDQYSIDYAIPINGSFDNTTVKVAKVPYKSKIIAVSFATGAALGSSVGIDVKVGSTVVVSSTDNLNGYEVKTAAVDVPANSDISVVFDDFTAATQCSVIIFLQQRP